LIRRAYNCSIGYTYDDLKEYSYGLFLDSDDLISLEYYSYIYEDILPYDVISFTYHVVDLDGVKSEYSSNEVHILSWMKIGMIHNRLIKMEVLNKMVKDHFNYEVPKICKGEDHLMVILIMTQDIKYINFSCIRNNYRFDNLPTYHYFNRSKNTIQDGSDQERWTFDAYHLIFHRLATNYPHILLALKSCCKKMVGKYLERCRRFGVTPPALLEDKMMSNSHITIIGGSMGSGKTTRMIQYCHDNDLIPVVSCNTAVQGMMTVAEDLGIARERPITYHQFLSDEHIRGRGRGDTKRYAIDNIEHLFAYMNRDVACFTCSDDCMIHVRRDI
jgi:hypothetical protein